MRIAPLLILLVGASLIWIGATDRAQAVHNALFTVSDQEGRMHHGQNEGTSGTTGG